jgi:hypothetical protein
MALQHLRSIAPAGRQESDLPALYAYGQSWAARNGYEGIGEETAVSLGMVAAMTGKQGHLHSTVRDHDRPAALRWAHRYARDAGYELDDGEAVELHRLRSEASDDGRRLRAYVKQAGRKLGDRPEPPPEAEPMPAAATPTAAREPLTEKLDLRLSRSEKAALLETSSKLGKTAGWFLRRALREAVEEEQAAPIDPYDDPGRRR